MDWLISRLRQWLCIDLDFTTLNARANSQHEQILVLEGIVAQQRSQIQELHRFAEEISASHTKAIMELSSDLTKEAVSRQDLRLSMESQLADLRRVATERQVKPVVRARSWTEARRLTEQFEDVNA